MKKTLTTILGLTLATSLAAEINYKNVNGNKIPYTTLESGQTIYSDVAGKYTQFSNGVQRKENIQKILDLNGIKDLRNIKSGQEILIPEEILKTNYKNSTDKKSIKYDKSNPRVNDFTNKFFKVYNKLGLDKDNLDYIASNFAMVEKESTFNPNALNKAGTAAGYYQLKIQAAQTTGFSFEEIKKDPMKNIEAGLKYRQYIQNKFKGYKTSKGIIPNKNLEGFELISYNLGETALSWLLDSKRYGTNDPDKLLSSFRKNIEKGKPIIWYNRFRNQNAVIDVNKQKEVVRYVDKIREMKNKYIQ